MRIGVRSHGSATLVAAGGSGTCGARSQLLVAVVLLVAATVSRADDAVCAQQEQQGLADNPASVVIPQLAPSCYGTAEEQQPLTQEVRALIDKDPTSERLAIALRTLAARVENGDLYGSQAIRNAFARSAEDAADDVARNLPSGQGRTSPEVWHVENGSVRAVPGLSVTGILDNGCPATADPNAKPCQDAINSAKAWLRVAHLADAALSRYAHSAIDELLTRSTNRLAMWHSYRDEALPQFQWEWFLNSWRLNRADKGPNGRARDADNQPIGPMKVPSDQIIFLHPGVGLEYRNRPDKEPAAGVNGESKMAPIIYLELLGRYRWSWDESTGKMIGGGGVSVVATYADRGNDTDVGYGLLFHSRRAKAYTLGITRSGDATNIILNVDLAEFFKDKLSYWKGVENAATQ
jgi:hypothetical protein